MFKLRLPALFLCALLLAQSLSLTQAPHARAVETAPFRAPKVFYNPAKAEDLKVIDLGVANKEPYFQALKAMQILGLSENPSPSDGAGYFKRLSPAESTQVLDLVQASSQAGHPLGLFLNCRLNREERFRPFNETEAYDACKRAVPGLESLADQNDAYAQFALGYIDRYASYESVVFKREGDAESNFLAAAKQGHVDAQYQLGLYYNYHGSTQEAKIWFEKAAQSGNPIAEAVYGNFLAYVIEDKQTAEVYLKRAAEHKNPLGLSNLALHYYYTDQLAKIPALNKIGAESGLHEYMSYWGMDLIKGEYVAKDQIEGLKWMERATENPLTVDSLNSQIYLANLYYEGTLIKRDYAQAMNWYQRAAREGISPLAILRIGEMHLYGQGVAKNPVEAFNWFSQATDMNISFFDIFNLPDLERLNLHLVRMYDSGLGVKADLSKSIAVLRKMTPYSSEAQYQLGIRYRDGKGQPQNRINAHYWLTIAAKSGHPEAAKALKALNASH